MVLHGGLLGVGGFIVSAILGLAILWLVNEFTKMDIPWNIISILLAVLFGPLGALIVIILVAVDVM